MEGISSLNAGKGRFVSSIFVWPLHRSIPVVWRSEPYICLLFFSDQKVYGTWDLYFDLLVLLSFLLTSLMIKLILLMNHDALFCIMWGLVLISLIKFFFFKCIFKEKWSYVKFYLSLSESIYYLDRSHFANKIRLRPIWQTDLHLSPQL